MLKNKRLRSSLGIPPASALVLPSQSTSALPSLFSGPKTPPPAAPAGQAAVVSSALPPKRAPLASAPGSGAGAGGKGRTQATAAQGPKGLTKKRKHFSWATPHC